VRLGVGAALVGRTWVEGDVRIEDGRVAEVGLRPSDSGLVAAPGFVDLQLNGAVGVDVRDASPPDLLALASWAATTGTTTFLPTSYSASTERYVDALLALAEAHDLQDQFGPAGARLGGAHLEGPFLSPVWAGAHDPTRLVEPDLLTLHRLVGAGPVSLMTLAPELPGALDLIARLRSAGIAVSLGHTDADAATCHAAFDAGASMLTHCWNAHRRLAARDPGPAATALTRAHVGLICDGVHVADDVLRMSFAAATGRVCVVTDAVAPTGTDWTQWSIDGATVVLDESSARLRDGTLAGSIATMDGSVRHLVGLGIAPADVITAASTTPAALVGATGHDLRPGSVADVVVLDGSWHVRRTLVGGREVHAA